MGYKLPDGRYVDDRGKTHKNYNDALAESRTLSRRDLEQQMLGQSNESLAQAQNNLEIARREKGLLGWIPGMGAYYDRALRQYANDAAYAETAVGARAKQLAATNARMGIGSPRASSDGGLDTAAKPQPKKLPTVLSDDVDARASEARRMLQQATPFWEREENKALKVAAGPVSQGGGPRASEVGYAQRADIQAWMDAQRAKGPAGVAMVERFMQQQRDRGLLEQPTPAVDKLIATPDQREVAAAGYEGSQPQSLQLEGSGSLQGGEMASNPTFTDPTFGIEALRGMPVDATASLMPGSNQRGELPAGYSGAAIRDVFNQPTPLPNMAFTGNGMEPDTQMTAAREQDVPGITGPVLSPNIAREMNLQGADALVNKYKLLAMQR